MERRDFLTLTGAAGLSAALPRVALAQQGTKVWRIAVLGTPLPAQRINDIGQGLADYGYMDGKNINVATFFAPTTGDIPAYAAMALAAKPDVILSSTTPQHCLP